MDGHLPLASAPTILSLRGHQTDETPWTLPAPHPAHPHAREFHYRTPQAAWAQLPRKRPWGGPRIS